MRRLSERNVSNQSIITIIEKFVKSVNTMEDTILIPSKLMDKQVCENLFIDKKYQLNNRKPNICHRIFSSHIEVFFFVLFVHRLAILTIPSKHNRRMTEFREVSAITSPTQIY